MQALNFGLFRDANGAFARTPTHAPRNNEDGKKAQHVQCARITSRPNVLWISTHDINPHLGAYAGVYPGAEYAVTPNLDRLAAEGVRFDNAFATAPVCAPSRSSIMTGCFPTSIGTMHMRSMAVPPPEVRLLPEYFREAGYYTANNFFTDFQVPTPDSAFDDCSETAHWRNRPSDDTPFFATFHGMITHESQIYLDDDAFAARTASLQAEQRHDPKLAPLPPYYPDTSVFRTAWARYSDLITEMDHWVGNLLQQLDDDGLTESTIVVFWSDHGLGMPRGKRWPNESGVREPLLVRWPKRIAAGSAQTGLAHLMDLAPTMLTIAGLSVPTHMEGVSLLDQDGRLVEHPNEYVFAGRDRMDEQEDTSRTVRDERYRYIRNYHPDRSAMQHCDYPDQLATWREMRRLAFEEANQVARGERRTLLSNLQRGIVNATKPAEELYDVLSDPYEERNLAADPSHGATLDRLRAALDEWQRVRGDLGLLPEEELLERWRPGGVWSVVEPPIVSKEGDLLKAVSPTAGSSVVWTTDAPQSDAAPYVPQFTGAPLSDGRQWQLLCAATPAPTDETVWLRAWRLGFLPSVEVPCSPV